MSCLEKTRPTEEILVFRPTPLATTSPSPSPTTSSSQRPTTRTELVPQAVTPPTTTITTASPSTRRTTQTTTPQPLTTQTDEYTAIKILEITATIEEPISTTLVPDAAALASEKNENAERRTRSSKINSHPPSVHDDALECLARNSIVATCFVTLLLLGTISLLYNLKKLDEVLYLLSGLPIRLHLSQGLIPLPSLLCLQ